MTTKSLPLKDSQTQLYPAWLSLKAAVFFFSTKAARSGPKFIISIAILLIAGFALSRLALSYQLPTALDYSQVIDWAIGDSSFATTTQDGDLRIVVFGEPDLTTPPRVTGNKDAGRSWVEQLCAELECSTYMSFVPTTKKGPAPSLASNTLYDNALNELLSKSHWVSQQPGTNFTFMQTHYNTPFHLPDLRAQISTFLAMKPSKVPPRETIYVFSFGTWDIWHLAGFPLGIGYTVVSKIASHIFTEVEELYQQARNPESIAYSASVCNRTTAATQEGNKVSTTEMKEQRTFRIVVPRLFDTSLVPGWQSRITPPKPHSRAEQLKNAAYLTRQWNRDMSKELEVWTRTQENTSEQDGTSISWPGPLRDVISPDVSSYLARTMIDGQLKYSGTRDNTAGSNLGDAPAVESFRDVTTACMSFREAISSLSSNSKWYQFSSTSAIESDQDEGIAPEAEKEIACDQHLFLSDFTVSQRAIDTIGLLTAHLVANNQSVRMEWEKARPAASGNYLRPSSGTVNKGETNVAKLGGSKPKTFSD